MDTTDMVIGFPLYLDEGGEGGGAGGGEGGEGGEGNEGGEQKTPEEIIAELTADRDKWKSQSRKHEARAKTNADAATKLQEIEDAKKSEETKSAEKTAKAEKDAADATLEAMRLRVALRKGLTETQAKRLVGTTEEELAEDADELLASFKKDDEEEDGGKPGTKERPKEKLRPGATRQTSEDPTDYREHAKKLPRF